MALDFKTRGCATEYLEPSEPRCPFFSGEYMRCRHPNAPPDNLVHSSRGGVYEQAEALHDRNDWATSVFHPTWCPLQVEPVLVQLVKERVY